MDFFGFLPNLGSGALTIVAFIVALSIIVAIHEYGHYIIGRWSGIKADVFSLGFGPVLWSGVDKHGTKWQVAALPFGGYVKFRGDANAASGKDDEAMTGLSEEERRQTMHGAPLWARTATVAAGPLFNFALSIIVFAAIFLSNGQATGEFRVGELRDLPPPAYTLQPGDLVLSIDGKTAPGLEDEGFRDFVDGLPLQPLLDYGVERDGTKLLVTGPQLFPPVIKSLAPQSAAYETGLKPDDAIQKIDGAPIFTFNELKQAVEEGQGRPLMLTIWRDGQEMDFELTPRRTDEPQPEGGFKTSWRIGIIGGVAFEPAKEALGFGDAVTGAVAQTGRIINGSLSGLYHMVTGAISSCNLSGPVGIAQTTGAMASQGLDDFIWFIAVLSTAIGMLNLFPIPMLDGGHLVFYAYEAVTGKPPSDSALRVLMTMGLWMVLSLMVFGLLNDLVLC